MNRKAAAFLAAMICVAGAGLLTSQESGLRRDQWYERGNMTEAPRSSVAAMVERQLRGRGITDARTLRAMASVAREKFIPPELRNSAYDDRPLPIGYGQTISQPYIVALMTEQIQTKPSHRVLEIGTGSGYQAAVLSELVAEVYSIEIVRPLAQHADVLLRELGYRNVHVKAGDGYKGWPEHAPFNAIIVTAAPDHVPQPLIDQLREGGRMVIPVGESGAQNLYLLEKRGGQIKRTAVIRVKFVPLTRDREG